MAEDGDPGSPLWWIRRLAIELDRRRAEVAKYDRYYRGHHPLLFASEKFKEAFGGLFGAFADNWCALVVDAVEERLDVQGFRLNDDPTGDQDAWRIWQTNGLDAESQIAHVEALIAGEASVLVWSDPDDDTMPLITIEHADSMIVATSQTNRRVRLAALKRWQDDEGYLRANLYMPDKIWKYRSVGKVDIPLPNVVGGHQVDLYNWVQLPDEEQLDNPLGKVPVVPLRNRPRLRTLYESELKGVTPLQDATNKLLADMIVASEYAAFPQRWATGLELEVDPETKQPRPPYKLAIDRLLSNENPGGAFGQFTAADLGNYVKGVETIVQHIASQSRTPPHYFYLSGQFPSGESIKSAETGLVSKARRKQRFFGEAWEEVIRLGFGVLDDPKADSPSSEVIWRDPESRTESEHVDAILKKQALNVPDEQLWEDLGYTPQQIERFKSMRAQDALMGLLTPPIPVPGTVAPQAPVAPPVA